MNDRAGIKVLILAEAANPEWVSVPLVGWSHARALMDIVDGHLVTQIRNREAILRAGLEESSDFTAIDSERVARRLWRLGKLLRGGEGAAWTTNTAIHAIAYSYFERLVWKRFSPAIRAGEFDLVHRITPLSPAIPSRLAGRCRRAGVPFVLGPLNGGVPWPPGFERERSREREWLSRFRSAHRLLPGYRSTRSSAAAILVGSKTTMAEMPPWVRDKCIYLPENAIDPSAFASITPRSPARPLRMIFVGRLVPLKGLDLLLSAIANFLRSGKLRLEIVGEGPDRTRLEQIVTQGSLEHAVSFGGWVDHADLPGRLAHVDLLALPSIREFGGGVVLEAMAAGIPALVLDYGGPGELVTPATGFAVPMGTRDQLINGLRKAVEQIVNDPSCLPEMGRRARNRIKHLFTWPVRAQMTREVYEWVLGRISERPRFSFDDESDHAGASSHGTSCPNAAENTTCRP